MLKKSFSVLYNDIHIFHQIRFYKISKVMLSNLPNN